MAFHWLAYNGPTWNVDWVPSFNCYALSIDDTQSDGNQKLETILEDKERENSQNLLSSDPDSGKEEQKTDGEGEQSQEDTEKKEETEKTETEADKEPQLPTE